MKTPAARAVLLLLFLTVWIPACKDNAKDPYNLVALQGPAIILRFQTTASSTLLFADSGQIRYVPLRDSELVVAFGGDNSAVFRYTKKTYDTLRISLLDSLFYINDQLYQVRLNDGVNMLPYLQSMSEQDRKHVRMLNIIGDVPAAYLPWLDSIARVNPGVDLYVQEDSPSLSDEHLRWLAARFRPTAMIVDADARQLPLLEGFSSIRDLYLALTLDDSTAVEPILPPLPALRNLSLVLDNSDDVFSLKQFFTHHRGLTQLALQSSRPRYEELSKAVPGVQKLFIQSSDSLQRLPYGTWFGKLEELFVNQPLAPDFDIASFQAGHPLWALGVSSSIRQDQFDTLISGQSQLHWLEIYGDDTLMVRDYSSLRRLKHLEYLSIEKKIGNIEALEPLHQLRYLSVPNEDSTDSVKFSRLERALPHTRITPNAGFCMGTGWILLMLPLTLAAAMFWRLILPAIKTPR